MGFQALFDVTTSLCKLWHSSRRLFENGSPNERNPF